MGCASFCFSLSLLYLCDSLRRTLATKKRRILHVVADSWEDGGGHFERRISFGYDADLAQVRAEFDGELLRVIIPRRIPTALVGALAGQPWGTPAPVGRGVPSGA